MLPKENEWVNDFRIKLIKEPSLINYIIDEYALHEIYSTGFETAVKNTISWIWMTACNWIMLKLNCYKIKFSEKNGKLNDFLLHIGFVELIEWKDRKTGSDFQHKFIWSFEFSVKFEFSINNFDY
jgi:hypothetical protein